MRYVIVSKFLDSPEFLYRIEFDRSEGALLEPNTSGLPAFRAWRAMKK
jgi:hypothetical protein